MNLEHGNEICQYDKRFAVIHILNPKIQFFFSMREMQCHFFEHLADISSFLYTNPKKYSLFMTHFFLLYEQVRDCKLF